MQTVAPRRAAMLEEGLASKCAQPNLSCGDGDALSEPPGAELLAAFNPPVPSPHTLITHRLCWVTSCFVYLCVLSRVRKESAHGGWEREGLRGSSVTPGS